MRRRTRKLIGAAGMLFFVIFYALVLMALAQAKPFEDAPGWLKSLFYIIGGMAWIVPLFPLIRWMERVDPEK